MRLWIGQANAGSSIVLVQGDITRETTDAIVNAANSELLPGGGVCGAIHRAGGPTIAEECRRTREERGSVPPGGAVATGGGNLSARYVIHAVGPMWSGGRSGEPDALASCYRESIRVARELKLNSIAFPAISTGIFGYPLREAAQVAVTTLADALADAPPLTVRFVVFDQKAFDAFSSAMSQIASSGKYAPDRSLETP
ncbi:MAG: O-acetyl-ADP-ribose deacetylase [Acidobacteria bacterium]|nr:O-acetyl-ADP-ribose deacetylase [Acidobacteriota bacterium]